MIELRLLGTVDLRAAGNSSPPLILAHQKRLALLAYLAAARPFGLHRRDSLVALLWPESDHEHARASLRKTLHGLRQDIGADALVSNGDEAIGIGESLLWCDVRAFDEALRTGRPTNALSIYRGDFLPGFFLSDAPEFDRWVEKERKELQGRAVRAAWTAAEEASNAGNAVACMAWSRRALQLTPDDEPGTRRLITLLDRAGDRAGAIRAFEQFERFLAEELGVGPSPETVALISGIRAQASPCRARSANTGLTTPGIVEGLVAARDDPGSMNSDPDSPDAASSEPVQGRLGERPGVRARFRRRATPVLALLAVLAVFAAVTAVRRTPRHWTSLDATHIAVMPLENRTGRSDLDFVGLEVQDWLSRGLQETGLARVYAASRAVASPTSLQGRPPADDDRNWAAGLGAGILVRGRYYLRADSILMEVSLVDVTGGATLATLAPVAGSTQDPTPAIDVVRRRATAVLATHVDPALKQWAGAASQPPSFEAYREFSKGQQAKNRDEYDAAITHFVRAATLDSGYVYPIIMAAQLELDVRSADSAAALLRAVRQRHLRLAPFDEALADALEAQLAHDLEAALDADQRLRRYVTTGSDWDLDAAAMAIALNRPRIAMEIVKSVDLHRPPALDHWDVFVAIANAHHLAGENAALLALLRKEAGKWQNAALVVVNKMQALAALSRTAEVDSEWRTLLHNRAYEDRAIVMWAAWQGARELRAHGSADAARRLAAEALDSLPTLPGSSKFGNPVQWRMEVLREAGRARDAWPIAIALAARRPKEPYFAATTAVLAAQLGDTGSARRIAARLTDWPAVHDPGNLFIARARVAAALGDQKAAVALLHEACDRGCMMMEDLHIVLDFDGLRSYPPFRELLRPKQGS